MNGRPLEDPELEVPSCRRAAEAPAPGRNGFDPETDDLEADPDDLKSAFGPLSAPPDDLWLHVLDVEREPDGPAPLVVGRVFVRRSSL